MDAIDTCWARLGIEEGRKHFAYNDSTGQRVTCQPGGNLSIAVGVNLEVGLDEEEIDWLSIHRLTKVHESLQKFPWYAALDPMRQSVLLDMGFGLGISGLLHFPAMITALSNQDWLTASEQCHVTDPKLAGRYAALAQILLTGAI